ncbi:MAG: hypothetical protein JWO44_1209 [Bacteroidetes bacterium]|nr:hypothetical protein [Bacteroidota bacterium]
MKSLFLSFLIIFSVAVKAQNLVPNFSFEQNDTCPTNEDQIQFAAGWSKYSQSITTPDYYNACAPSSGFGVPKNLNCNQPAHRNCSAYAGLVIYDANGYREHIGIQLNTPLVIGQKYFISFYVVMGEAFGAGFQWGMPSNNIGMRLSTIEYNPSNPAPIDNFAHLNSSIVISDSVNWVRISGSIIADSAYNHVILGNFFDNANTDTTQYSCGFCLNSASYYLIDDICVTTDSLLANGGIDALSCSVSVPEIDYDSEINVFPNPATEGFTILFQNSQNSRIVLTDMYGKVCYSNEIINDNTIKINLSAYPSGMYFLKIINQKEKKSASKKIIKL